MIRTKYYKDDPEKVRIRNLVSHAIDRICERIAGGREKYRALDDYARAQVRKGATRLHAAGQTYATALSHELTDRDGFVYAITHPAYPGYVKVGRAFDPESRLAGYQTGCPHRAYELFSAHYFEDCHFAEKEIHARLKDYRAEGEWFRVTEAFADQHIRQLRETL